MTCTDHQGADTQHRSCSVDLWVPDSVGLMISKCSCSGMSLSCLRSSTTGQWRQAQRGQDEQERHGARPKLSSSLVACCFLHYYILRGVPDCERVQAWLSDLTGARIHAPGLVCMCVCVCVCVYLAKYMTYMGLINSAFLH
uniref:Uncharacterized protein n=1 Tax=Myotis myotis TaxID=51298 RepID=A0A7J7Z5B0_MYOMY|nr:hypothetical protein mMyoMyo1_010774 [Myotis myotis]